MNIEEAKQILKSYLEYPEMDNIELMKKAIETVLSELENKEAIINEMAGHIILMNDSRGLTNEEKIKYFIDMVEREGK